MEIGLSKNVLLRMLLDCSSTGIPLTTLTFLETGKVQLLDSDSTASRGRRTVTIGLIFGWLGFCSEGVMRWDMIEKGARCRQSTGTLRR